MTYNWYARKALNPNLPIGVRRGAFFSCISSMSFLSGERYRHLIERYDNRFHFYQDKTDVNKLLLALAAMEIDRNQVLEELRAFDKKRLREKMRGKRTLSKVETTQFKYGCKLRSNQAKEL